MSQTITIGMESPLGDDWNEIENETVPWPGNLYLQSLDNARPIWNELLHSSMEVTLYHRESWLGLLSRAYGLNIRVATLERNGWVDAGCVFVQSNNPFMRQMKALPFSDYCWPLASTSAAQKEFMSALTRYSGAHRAWEVRGIRGPSQWQTVNCFSTWILDLAQPLSAIEKKANEAYRRQARRARAEGVQIEKGSDSTFLRRFYAMQLETRRRLGVPAQPLRFFELVREIFAPENAFQVWIASQEGRDLAGLVTLIDGGRLYYKWAARRQAGSSGTNHQLVWSLIEEFAGKAETLDLGRTDDRNEGLVRFKRHLGARRVELPYTFFPKAPRNVSSEIPTGARKVLSRVWRRLPLRVTRTLGSAIYPYLT